MTQRLSSLLALLVCLLIAACSSSPVRKTTVSASKPRQPSLSSERLRIKDTQQANEIVLFSLGLLDTGYHFGGKNPEAGLDCSGMVGYVVEQTTGLRLPHNAAKIAEQTRPIDRNELRPADLVFFNTSGQTFSHMGIYLGDGKFIHAPSSGGRVRVDQLDSAYFANRFSGARTLF